MSLLFYNDLQNIQPRVIAKKKNKIVKALGDNDNDSMIKVAIFYGAKLYNHLVFMDSKSGGVSKKIWSGTLPLPVNRNSLVEAANNALLSSSNRCEFSDDYHFLFEETIDQANSHACKPSKEKLLPICVPVQETYLVANNEHKPDHLHILIYRKDQPAMKGSYGAGSHGEDCEEDKLQRAYDAFAAGLCMEYATNKIPKYMHGLTPKVGISRERQLEAFKEMGKLAYQKNPHSHASGKFPTSTEILLKIKATLDSEDRSQQLANELPADVLVNGLMRSSSVTHPQAALPKDPPSPHAAAVKVTDDMVLPGLPYVTTRADAQAQSSNRHTVQWLNDIQQSLNGLEVQLAEDCGKGEFKEGDWFRLLAVYVKHDIEARANESFLVELIDRKEQKIIKWKHFLKQSPEEVSKLLVEDSD